MTKKGTYKVSLKFEGEISNCADEEEAIHLAMAIIRDSPNLDWKVKRVS